jgi:hypothetical protein
MEGSLRLVRTILWSLPLAIAALSGCACNQPAGYPEIAVGRTYESALKRLGPPDFVATGPEGVRVYSWSKLNEGGDKVFVTVDDKGAIVSVSGARPKQ